MLVFALPADLALRPALGTGRIPLGTWEPQLVEHLCQRSTVTHHDPLADSMETVATQPHGVHRPTRPSNSGPTLLLLMQRESTRHAGCSSAVAGDPYGPRYG